MFIQCTLARQPRADARCLCVCVCDLGSRWSTQRQTMSLEASVDARSKDDSKKQLRPSAAPGIFIYKTQISYISLLTHPVFITPSLSLPHHQRSLLNPRDHTITTPFAVILGHEWYSIRHGDSPQETCTELSGKEGIG